MLESQRRYFTNILGSWPNSSLKTSQISPLAIKVNYLRLSKFSYEFRSTKYISFSFDSSKFKKDSVSVLVQVGNSFLVKTVYGTNKIPSTFDTVQTKNLFLLTSFANQRMPPWSLPSSHEFHSARLCKPSIFHFH